MLRQIHLYMCSVDGTKYHPELLTCHDVFSNACLSSRGLSGLAEQLESTIHVGWEQYSGKIPIHAYAVGVASRFNTKPLTRVQRKEFQSYLKDFRINWVKKPESASVKKK